MSTKFEYAFKLVVLKPDTVGVLVRRRACLYGHASLLQSEPGQTRCKWAVRGLSYFYGSLGYNEYLQRNLSSIITYVHRKFLSWDFTRASTEKFRAER